MMFVCTLSTRDTKGNAYRKSALIEMFWGSKCFRSQNSCYSLEDLDWDSEMSVFITSNLKECHDL